MKHWISISLAMACLLPGASIAQQDAMERLTLRVTSPGIPGAVVIDRGARDKLKIGDVVRFFPSQGGTWAGTVTQIEERSSLVELHDKTKVPDPGTRGEALIPRDRLGAAPKPAEQPGKPAPDKPPTDKPPTGKSAEDAPTSRPHEPWRNQDEKFTPDKPLLAQVRPVRPEEREMIVSGRDYLIADLTHAPRQDFDNSFLRVGTDLQLDNPIGDGGTLRFNPEVAYRTEQNDFKGTDLVIRRASYRWGGSRFTRTSTEIGRFLQQGMPEFGILDGVEWSQRRDNGHRFGFSAGWMPEPDDDMTSFKDLQLAVYYQWVPDPSESLSVAAGFQKTFHEGETDRDLFVARINAPSLDGWSFFGTAWVDFYFDSDDDAKSSALGLTQAVMTLSRHFAGNRRLAFSYLHSEFPDIERENEFRIVNPNQIAHDHYDRLDADGQSGALHGRASGWIDEDDVGGSLEAGLEIADLFVDGGRGDVTVFGTSGRFASVLGFRVLFARVTPTGGWDALYEFSNQHQNAFPSGIDDVPQHRLRGSWNALLGSGWYLAAYAEGRTWDDEGSISLGFHLQRTY